MNFVSLFTGIGGFDLGFDRSGMECVLQVEQDKHCLELLGNRWPSARKITDIRKVTGREKEIRSSDLVCGGFPCQDVSVAGRRKGLAGERSGLWFEFHRIIAKSKPRWVVIENVPGLLSSNKGKDFAVILRGLVECGYGVAWRILDAQYFGLAQRRRRVFIVGSLGSGRAAEVLFERESGHWDSPSRRETRQDVTEVAGTLAANAGGTNRPAGNANELDFCVAFSAGNSGDSYGIGYGENVTPPLRAGNSGTNQVPSIAKTVTANYGKQPDSSNSSTPRNFVITYNIQHNDGGEHKRKDRPNGGLYINETDTALTVGSTDLTVVARSLTSRNERIDFETENFIVADTAPTIDAGYPTTAFDWRQGADSSDGFSQTLSTTRTPADSGRMSGVRRLTPTECERLQGFPDGWTAGFTDSVRYRMLGNAVAVPCAEWIAKRIKAST